MLKDIINNLSEDMEEIGIIDYMTSKKLDKQLLMENSICCINESEGIKIIYSKGKFLLEVKDINCSNIEKVTKLKTIIKSYNKKCILKNW